jgi:hypothetical protein
LGSVILVWGKNCWKPPLIKHCQHKRASKSVVRLCLLSAPLTIPLVCCQINNFRRASSYGEAMARRRKEERRAGIASRGMRSAWVVSPPVCGHPGVHARDVVPERCHSSGSAVDARRDPPAGAQRAARVADSGVVCVSRAFSGAPRASRITAQRGARCDP